MKGGLAMGKNATIVEIARECNVSIATVSRVLHGSSAVTPATRAKVEAAIERQGYTPNALARSLVSNQSMTLGVIVPDISNPYFSVLFTQIEQAAISVGYNVFLCNTFYFSSSYQTMAPLKKEEEYFKIMLQRQVDGVLIIGGQIDLVNISPDYLKALDNLSKRIPVVVLGRVIDGLNCIFIEHETGSGVITAINYLASLGHRRIAFVGGEPGVFITETRLSAYRNAMAALDLPTEDTLISLSDYYAKDGYQAAQALIRRDRDFTAVLAVNDSVALGAMRAMRDEGLTVPDDVSLISCDQFYHANYFIPRLTSIDQHTEVLGRLIIQALLGAIKGVSEPALIKCTPELILRESCCPPAKGR